jgi:hypothetical protein
MKIKENIPKCFFVTLRIAKCIATLKLGRVINNSLFVFYSPAGNDLRVPERLSLREGEAFTCLLPAAPPPFQLFTRS